MPRKNKVTGKVHSVSPCLHFMLVVQHHTDSELILAIQNHVYACWESSKNHSRGAHSCRKSSQILGLGARVSTCHLLSHSVIPQRIKKETKSSHSTLIHSSPNENTALRSTLLFPDTSLNPGKHCFFSYS